MTELRIQSCFLWLQSLCPSSVPGGLFGPLEAFLSLCLTPLPQQRNLSRFQLSCPPVPMCKSSQRLFLSPQQLSSLSRAPLSPQTPVRAQPTAEVALAGGPRGRFSECQITSPDHALFSEIPSPTTPKSMTAPGGPSS